MADINTVQIANPMQYYGAHPLDIRSEYASIEEMAAMKETRLFDGCFAYVTGDEDRKTYQWWSTNMVDPVLGRWREFGGSGGTNNYEELSKKPKINDVTLQGNLTRKDLNLENAIESITLNKAPIEIDSDKNINIDLKEYTKTEDLPVKAIKKNGEKIVPSADGSWDIKLDDYHNAEKTDELVEKCLEDAKKYTNEAMKSVKAFQIINVDELPAEEDANKQTIYLVPIKDDAGQPTGSYLQYILMEEGWTILGDTSSDMTQYAKQEYVENELAKKANADDIPDVEDFITVDETDEKLKEYQKAEEGKGLSANDYTDDEKNKVGQIKDKISVLVVESLPESDTDRNLYFVADPDNAGKYVGWMYLNGAWSNVTSHKQDLSPYAKTEDVNAELDKKVGLEDEEYTETVEKSKHENRSVLDLLSSENNVLLFDGKKIETDLNFATEEMIEDYWKEEVNNG